MEPWTFDPATLQPFTEGKKYRDEFETGLYPGGKNELPQAHRVAKPWLLAPAASR